MSVLFSKKLSSVNFRTFGTVVWEKQPRCKAEAAGPPACIKIAHRWIQVLRSCHFMNCSQSCWSAKGYVICVKRNVFVFFIRNTVHFIRLKIATRIFTLCFAPAQQIIVVVINEYNVSYAGQKYFFLCYCRGILLFCTFFVCFLLVSILGIWYLDHIIQKA